MIHAERIRNLNDEEPDLRGSYVVYWMQASVRSHWNHALEYAIETANSLKKPLLVVFGLTDDFPNANSRHYRFLIEGLRDVRSGLQERGMQLVVERGSPPSVFLKYADDAVAAVTDRGYLDIQREWVETAAGALHIPLTQVESNVIVPVETASDKEEYSAGTFRPKITRQLKRFMVPLRMRTLHVDSLDLEPGPEFEDVMRDFRVRDELDPSIFRGGTSSALKIFDEFLREKLECFERYRNDPVKNCLSNMSPYLHFGHISPLYLALRASEAGRCPEFLEELIVRRELSMNFVHYSDSYSSISCLPEWAHRTLMDHVADPREYEYSLHELESASTHDPYWNAAQKEMVITGKMHGYMRMYWGKKILEWTDHPARAYDIALYLNDRYEIDGRDPNGFAGVAWCFGKHDRAWAEREIFGKVRYMNDRGLKRKFRIDDYVDRIRGLMEDGD
ncbi:DNA deoxyribodipyrimidine photolyase [Methanothermobacter sp. CaT2]|uniref:deoxyribodipyrimidine photo-lyase n=1 Tax=Methanothermobacter sp. CaT2 TaxID=866790 RepID=UPI0002CCFFB6|nr:deoxyribodipyrimidine photo-lyase [Methanothermobacter sp. CaT2]BAM70069.1 DNA deoxyribodipyrimidine photolyase [Methanothermobacter sp. CaT2]